MTRPRRFALLMVAALALVPAAGLSDRQIPAPATAARRPAIALAGRVTDAARILTAAQVVRLTARLAALEHATRRQLVVVTAPALHGQDIALYTRNLGNAWGIGRAGYDDGVVVLVAPRERKVRIAVGRGLERDLPDALCARIIAEQMIPRFIRNDFGGGLERGVAALDRALR